MKRLLFLLSGLLMLFPTIALASETGTPDGAYERALVKDIGRASDANASTTQQIKTTTVEFLSGSLIGQTKTLRSDIDSNAYSLSPSIGDKVLIYIQQNPQGGEPLLFLESYDRRGPLIGLVLLFIFVMVLLAGKHGLGIVFSILSSVALIGFVLIPAYLKGLNPIPIAIVLGLIFVTISSAFSMGWNRKTFATILGTLGGTMFAFLVAYLFASWSHLSGLSTEEDRMFFDNNPTLNPQGLLFAGIIIASLGVVEDVAVSIASGVMEVHSANHSATFRELFRSGMVIGVDHMGALANTLVFAYVGGSLSTLLLYTQHGGSWAKFMNFDSVTDEVIRSLAGTIGLVFTVPITALVAAWMATKHKSPSFPRRG